MGSPPYVKSVRARILILSDTHGRAPPTNTTNNSNYAFRSPLPEADILLHAGDLTMSGRMDEHSKTVSMLLAARAELKVVIPGNHDLTLDSVYYASAWGRRRIKPYPQDVAAIRALYTGPEAVAAGIVYMEEGVRTFTLKSSGATFTLYASAYTPEFCHWGFAYDPAVEDRFNRWEDSKLSKHNTSPPQQPEGLETQRIQPANPVPSSSSSPTTAAAAAVAPVVVDIMLTHGPPLGILDETHRGENVGCPHLRTAVERCRPRVHAFGHIHEGWGAVRVDWEKNNDNDDDDDHPLGEKNQFRVEVDPPALLRERGAAYLDLTAAAAGGSATAGEGGEGREGGVPQGNGRETLFVNASIMDVNYVPRNAPWLLDLDLELLPVLAAAAAAPPPLPTEQT